MKIVWETIYAETRSAYGPTTSIGIRVAGNNT